MFTTGDGHPFNQAQCSAPAGVACSLFPLETYCDIAMSIIKFIFFITLALDLCEDDFSQKGSYENVSEGLTIFF